MGVIAEVNRTCSDLADGISPSAMRQQAVGQIMEDMAEVLAQPLYTGDIDSALIHHMGRAAFTPKEEWWHHDVQDYVQFAEQVEEQAETADSVPVLFSFSRKGDTGLYTINETALTVVDSDPPRFQSRVEHERNVEREGYVGRIAVIRRTLLLLGDTTVIKADLTAGRVKQAPVIPSQVRIEESGEGLVLSQTTQIDGHNRSTVPLKRDYDGSKIDIEHFGIHQNALIGWEQIVPVLTKGVYYATQNNDAVQTSLQHVLRLRNFFEKSGQLEELCDHSPIMKKIFEQATSLQASLSTLVPAASPMPIE